MRTLSIITPILLAIIIVVSLAGVTFCFAGDVNTLQNILDGQRSGVGALGMGTVNIDSNGYRSDATAMSGSLVDTAKLPFVSEGSLRGQGFGEVLLASAVVKLVRSLALPQLDESIPAQLLPQGLPFVNPDHAGKPLTLRMLLQHTSSLKDTARISQAPFVVASGTQTQDIISFGNSVFLSSVGGSFSVAGDIWNAGEPGLAVTHSWAASNVALLTYVVQQKITSQPSLVTGPQKTVWAYIQEQIISPLGLISTYVLLPDCSKPIMEQGIQNIRGANTNTKPTQEKTEASYLSGTYMVQTSLTDIARLFYELFMGSNSEFLAIGGIMLTAPVAVTETKRPGVTQQGLGIVMLNRDDLCNSWAATTTSRLSSTCPYSAGVTIPGFVSIIDATSTTAFHAGCSAPTTSVLAATTTVAAGTITLGGSGGQRCWASAALSTSSAPLNGATVPTALRSVSSESVLQSTTTSLDLGGFSSDVITPDTQKRDVAFGFSLFGCLAAIFLGILVWSYINEVIVTPAPLAGPLVTAAYPNLENY